jgi:peptidoglycan/LPS O-acetylase OafA/YrhL
LFHIDAKWIPGGFLGVDIFFVISGYLITLILTKEVEATNKVNIVSFYKRRIKRIIPALLFVLIPTFVVGFLLFTPDDLLALSKSMIWAFFSAANIYFFSSIDTGYFAAGSSELPLLHLWSLGVEEQFYILWPFVVLLLLKYVSSIKKRILITSVFFIASLAWAQSIIITDHSFAYYMLFTRAWELMAGAMAALLVYSGFRIRGLVSELLASIGLLMIILSLIFVSESDPVPGIAALPVIIGVALLILSGTSYHTYVGRILSLKILVAIGLVSYSAYLWHWPILAYLRYALIEIDLTISIFVVLVTFAMATVSYFIIETPLRKNDASSKNVFLWYFIIPAIAMVSVSTLTTQAIKYKSNFIFPWDELDKVNSNILPTGSYKYSCDSHLQKVFNDDICVYPKYVKEINAFLIGDSNAAHYLGVLRVFSDHYGFSIRNATKSACPLIFDGEFDWISTDRRKPCAEYRHAIFAEAIKYDTVIVGVSWNYYYDKEGFKKRFENTIDMLSNNVRQIIILGKIPIFPKYNKDCEIRSVKLSNLNCKDRFNNILNEHPSNQWLREITKKYLNVQYFDIRSQLCPDGTCSPYLQGQPVYYDEGHLSMNGSELIGENMIDTNDPMLHVFDHLKGKKQTFKPHIEIKDQKNRVSFSLNPRPEDKQIAFYLYKDEKRIDTQWYSTNLTYKLDKKKFGPGKYRVRYFIVDEKEKDPGKAKKSETGFSDYVTVQ